MKSKSNANDRDKVVAKLPPAFDVVRF